MSSAAGSVPSKAHRLSGVLAGTLAGTALQLAQPELFAGAAYAALLLPALVLLAVCTRRRTVGRAMRWLLLLSAAVSAFALTGIRAVLFQQQALDPALEGRDLVVTGVVVAMPQTSEIGTRFRLRVEQAHVDGVPVRLPPRLLLGWYTGQGRAVASLRQGAQKRVVSALHAGERWRMTVRLKAPHGNHNPSGFDYELWLWEQDLQATGYVRLVGDPDAAPRLIAQTWSHPVEWARQRVRDRILARLAPGDQAGVVAALVTGDQNAIDRADWDVFRATGVAHLVSISGLHVTMFAWLAAALVAAAWRRSARLCLWLPAPHAALLGGLLLAAAYALFSGWGVPAQRTIWMLATVCVLRLTGRQWPWPVVWLLACAVVVAIDPWALLSAGFWLSFIAVAVLFASAERSDAAVSHPLRRRLWALLREQWVVTVALAPLVLVLFGQVSVVSLLANLLAIPWVTLLVTPLALAGVAWPVAWDVAAALAELLAWYLRLLASWPWASLAFAAAPWWIAAAGMLGGGLLVLRLPASLRLAGVALVLPLVLWQPQRPVEGAFELLAVDVGQGNAVLVRTARHVMLYDAGPRYASDSDAGHRVLVPLLRALDLRLDLLVVSHRDNDHAGGAPSVLAMHPQARLLTSIDDGHSLREQGAGTRCEAGQSWHWDGVDFAVLFPDAADYRAGGKPNAVSCVVRVSARAASGPGAAALLTGDIEAAQEAQLVARGAALRADVLLVPHHGSQTSSSAPFLDAVAPRLALVQSGYRNRFGHPAPGPVQRYAQRGVGLYDSPRCGAMRWRSDEPDRLSCLRIDEPRYWRHVVP